MRSRPAGRVITGMMIFFLLCLASSFLRRGPASGCQFHASYHDVFAPQLQFFHSSKTQLSTGALATLHQVVRGGVSLVS